MTDPVLTYMRLAVDEAKKSKSEDDTHHPKVGVVIVRDKVVLGSAHRGELGAGDHAEFTLLEKKLSEVELKGATLFTTLEPCTARGSHKPCLNWIVEKGIARVFIGMLDPNPRVHSQGLRKLREHGIEVMYFPTELREEIEADNLAFILQFRANPNLAGKAAFNYTDNDGLFTIGHGEWLFETMWTKASDVAIYVYNDPPSIAGVAVALDARNVSDLRDASVYNMSSRTRTPREGQFVVLRNVNGYFAAIQIQDIKDRDRSDTEDELVFQYWILDDKTADFSAIAALLAGSDR